MVRPLTHTALSTLVLACSMLASPALAQGPAEPRPRERVREGMFLTARPGGILRVSTGDWVFVPQDTGQGPKLRPMVILPSQTLTRLAAGAQVMTGTAAGVVSGQVFVYRGREYLLPTAYRIIAPEEINRTADGQKPEATDAPAEKDTPPEKDTSANAEKPVPPTDASPRVGAENQPEAKPLPKDLAGDPSVEELVRDLEARKTQPRALTPRTGGTDRAAPAGVAAAGEAKSGDKEVDAAGDAGKAIEAPVESFPEGKLITSMRGRVTRTSEGELAFSRDADTDSPAGGAMVLLPCQTLQSIEELTAWRGETLVLEVSGRVFEYESRRYLLATMFVVQPPSETRPTQ